MSTFAPAPSTVTKATANLSQVAATYDLVTATGGDVLVTRVTPFVSVAATGLVSITMQTNNTAADAVLASTLLNALTGGTKLAVLATPVFLPSGKKIQYTIVGTGTAGSLKVALEYQPLDAGATLA